MASLRRPVFFNQPASFVKGVRIWPKLFVYPGAFQVDLTGSFLFMGPDKGLQIQFCVGQQIRRFFRKLQQIIIPAQYIQVLYPVALDLGFQQVYGLFVIHAFNMMFHFTPLGMIYGVIQSGAGPV